MWACDDFMSHRLLPPALSHEGNKKVCLPQYEPPVRTLGLQWTSKIMTLGALGKASQGQRRERWPFCGRRPNGTLRVLSGFTLGKEKEGEWSKVEEEEKKWRRRSVGNEGRREKEGGNVQRPPGTTNESLCSSPRKNTSLHTILLLLKRKFSF